MVISEKLRDKLIELLQEASVRYYNDEYGPHGYECVFCGKQSFDGASPPLHSKDCEGMKVIQELPKVDDE